MTESGIRPFGRSLYSIDNLLDHILRTFEEPIVGDLEAKKKTCTEILSAFSTLLVLDNMETVSDARILDYLQHLPHETQAKVLLTSRQKTGGWEYAIPVSELMLEETEKFLEEKAAELYVDFPRDETTCRKVRDVSGGLPLAIQWIIGQYKLSGNLDTVLNAVGAKDSPVLEFSFRNIWAKLSPDARATLAGVTIFDEPPTAQQLTIATEWPLERIEKALAELAEVTLVTPHARSADGQVAHVALPITLNFAKHQFAEMGDFEVACRRRVHQFSEQLELQKSETYRFAGIFDKYGLETESERKAAILCRRGQSELFSGNANNADEMFKQARELAPRSTYVLATSALYELARNRVGVALDMAKKACVLCDKRTGELCFTALARVCDVQHDRYGTLHALQEALKYAPKDTVIRHQYGVALSRAGRTKEAVEQFTTIIEAEKQMPVLRPTLLMAYKTRIINLRRLGKAGEAAEDLLTAKRLIADNPHFQSQASHIAELEE